eukprot:CAMPEP_0198351616 /NCGR_PEP_ID=MMETSP1450-20131203/103591_1 /TAXON_ID=753684 ORGANISM="Madagascaria erythrocladiodes, Strain CCMP3234" /NCGR_SAMPLE_ID=MMETSP1450 /ASSEMBLY_ACC=CAM_ASM_001115 /LENGTH=36 /DNA_ID= /DNA_START= /DNA_END= /DNA_ORIENTATION=
MTTYFHQPNPRKYRRNPHNPRHPSGNTSALSSTPVT